MGFIDTYIGSHRIGDLTEKKRENLDALEKELDKSTAKGKDGLSFSDAVKQHADKIADLVERLRSHFAGFKLTWGNAFSAFKFVYGIAVEAYQIVDAIQDSVIPDGLSEEQAKVHKTEFGKQLVYFIWKTIDPLEKKFRWVPFKSVIERKLVMWLAEMAIESAAKIFDNKDLNILSAKEFVKAL